MTFLIVLERGERNRTHKRGDSCNLQHKQVLRTDVGMNWNNKDHNLLIALFFILFIIQESSDISALSVLQQQQALCILYIRSLISDPNHGWVLPIKHLPPLCNDILSTYHMAQREA